MTLQTFFILLALILMVVFLFLGRKIYLRSVRLRHRLQMGKIFTNITHELLTPLTVISASVDQLREEEPKYNHEYDLMQLNIQRMVRLLQQTYHTLDVQLHHIVVTSELGLFLT